MAHKHDITLEIGAIIDRMAEDPSAFSLSGTDPDTGFLRQRGKDDNGKPKFAKAEGLTVPVDFGFGKSVVNVNIPGVGRVRGNVTLRLVPEQGTDLDRKVKEMREGIVREMIAAGLLEGGNTGAPKTEGVTLVKASGAKGA